jgi:hypothetical protein
MNCGYCGARRLTKIARKRQQEPLTREAPMIRRRALLAPAQQLVWQSDWPFATNADAQNYPDKPIKMIVPFPPGGPIDTMARLTGQSMSASLGQQVIVENRPGAGSTIGFKAAAAADPDGYTLLFGSSGSLGVAPALYPSLDVDPLKHFVTVATTSLLAAHHGGRPRTCRRRRSRSSSPTPRPTRASSTMERDSARRRIS